MQIRNLIAQTAGVLTVVLALPVLSAESGAVTSGDWAPIQKAVTVTVEDGTMKVNDKEVAARTLIYSRSSSSFTNAVGVPVVADLMEYPVISFRLKLALPSGAPDNFIVSFFGEDNWYLKNEVSSLVVKFLEHASEVAPGEYEFVWDGREKFQQFDMSAARSFVLVYPTEEIPEGETVKMSVSDVSFQK